MEVDGRVTLLNLYDSSAFMSELGPHVRESNVLIVCSRFDTPAVFGDVQLLCKSVANELADDPLLVVVRTQADRGLPWIEFGKTLSFCRRNQFPLISCSAKTRTNIDFVFRVAARMYFNRLDRDAPFSANRSIT